MPHGQDVQTWRSNSTCFRVPIDVRGTVVRKVVSEVKFKATLNHATKDKPSISSRAIKPTTSQFTKARHFRSWSCRPKRTVRDHSESEEPNIERCAFIDFSPVRPRSAIRYSVVIVRGDVTTTDGRANVTIRLTANSTTAVSSMSAEIGRMFHAHVA